MSRLLVHVEGETEEDFVKEILSPHLQNFGYTQVKATKVGKARQRASRGGICSWNDVKYDVLRHLKGDSELKIALIVDFYGMPHGTWPNRADAHNLPFQSKASHVSNAISQDIIIEMGENFNPNRFIPYIAMYEFESLLFSDPEIFVRGIGHAKFAKQLTDMRVGKGSPEEINDSPHTAPSKRLKSVIPDYDKRLMGILGIIDIGLNKIREECPHFNVWLEQLEAGC